MTEHRIHTRNNGAALPYCRLACTEFEVPVPLLTVAATEARLCKSVWPVWGVPVRVNGIVTANCPPNDADAVLENHAADTWLISRVSWDVPMLNPGAGVNVTLNEVKLRVVEYPMTTRLKLLLD